MSKFTKYDQEMFEIFSDPVKWVAHHLGEEPRWYQAQILRHPHHRKVLRCGRRVGKCIEAEQRIMNPETGEYVTVHELFTREKETGEQLKLLTLNEKYHFEKSYSFNIEDNGKKEAFTIRLKDGSEVSLTGNHPVLTLDGWVEVDSLKLGDRIATPRALPYFGEEEMNEKELILLAYMLAGGNIRGSKVTFQSKNGKAVEEFSKVAKEYGCRVVKDPSSKHVYFVVSKTDSSNPILLLLKKHNVFFLDRLPQVVYRLKREQVALFLNRLYSVDGWAYSNTRPEVGYSTSFKQIVKDIKHLLLRFGVESNLVEKKTKYKDSEYIMYHLLIFKKLSTLLFETHINILGKEEFVDEASEKLRQVDSTEHTIPVEIWEHIERERKEKKMSKSCVAGSTEARLRTSMAPSRSKVLEYSKNLQSAFLYDIANADVVWQEVMEIKSIGEKQTYDVFVPETHNLIAEDVCVHNTWTMTAHMLWVAFTCNGGSELKKGATCLVATPYDTQAREIFDQLNNFINGNPVLQASVESIRRSPYEIVLKNKSRIKLYTAGTRSGAEGGSLRGQKASYLYIDEIDYLGDKDFEAIYAISLEAPQRIGVMCASTPTGRRGKFYSLCTEMRTNQEVPLLKGDKTRFDTSSYDRKTATGWKEFHFPTMVNPEWDDAMQEELRSMYSQAAYEHEVLAEFGTESLGVFNKEFIDEACSNGYPLLSYPKIDSPIVCGIDWDKARQVA